MNCPKCKKVIPEKTMQYLVKGIMQSCPSCSYILTGEELGLEIQEPKNSEETSLILELAEKAQKKKKRKLKAYYCPYCNDPKSKLNENQLNLLEMGMVVLCKTCGASIKSTDFELY
ncbi:MAG: hypothetical protein ACTSO9_02345 [Candidatus Helarchaeota archaeon]